MQEGFRESERASVADGAAEDATQDVVAVRVAGLDPVGDGEPECAQMVGDDTESDIVLLLLGYRDDCTVTRGSGERGTIGAPSQFPDLLEIGAENVCLVVGDRRAEVGEVLRALHDAGNPLESHACVDMAGREGNEAPVRIGVELDEDQVPNLDALGASLVDEPALGVAVLREVDMEFGAGAAGSRLTHHPEIILPVAWDDMDRWIESLGAEQFRPEGMGLLVEGGRISGFRAVDRCVESLGWEFPSLHDQFPRPLDRLTLEVIPERPISQHLEKGVVVRIEPNILEVVMLSAGAYAFLRV